MFLTPDLEPVFGGTYFPGPGASHEVGSVPFIELLEKLRDIWKTQEQRCRDNAKEITAKLRRFAEEGVHTQHLESGPNNMDLDLLEEAYRLIAHQYDKQHGGFSKAPKFPTSPRLQFLLNLSQWPSPVTDIVGREECVHAVSMATETLVKIARGGIRDQIGYGISRYSVTKDWSLPHFEKMLYDQALLLNVYLDAYTISGQPELLGVVYDIATYLTQPPIYDIGTGCFSSSEDADSHPSQHDVEAREGAFYVWTHAEILSLFPSQQEANIITRFYNIKPHGNISPKNDPHDELHNQNVLSIADTPKKIAKDLGLNEADVYAKIKAARIKMRDYREQNRPRPALDNKIVVSWNGLAIAALARASAALITADPTSANDWLSTALNAATFINTSLWDADSKTLYRIHRHTRSNIKALVDDYAALITACIELYNTTFNLTWLRWADELQTRQNELFLAEGSLGFYTTESHPTDLLLRLKQGMDSAEPSANALSAHNLLRLGALLEDESYVELARKTIAAFETEIEQYPASFPGLLSAGIWSVLGGKRVMIVGDDVNKAKAVKVKAEAETTRQDLPSTELSLESILNALRRTTGVGRTVLRVTANDGEDFAWLKKRNRIIGWLDVSGKLGLRILLCEKGACREVQRVEEIF